MIKRLFSFLFNGKEPENKNMEWKDFPDKGLYGEHMAILWVNLLGARVAAICSEELVDLSADSRRTILVELETGGRDAARVALNKELNEKD